MDLPARTLATELTLWPPRRTRPQQDPLPCPEFSPMHQQNANRIQTASLAGPQPTILTSILHFCGPTSNCNLRPHISRRQRALTKHRRWTHSPSSILSITTRNGRRAKTPVPQTDGDRTLYFNCTLTDELQSGSGTQRSLRAPCRCNAPTSSCLPLLAA